MGANAHTFRRTAWRSGPARLVVAAAASAVLVLWFAFLEHRPLIDPDEGRYAEIPREMVASGDWLTPRLDGLLYFEKPPLQYWATAAAYKAFGQAHWTSRLWTALTGLAGVLLAFYAGLRLWSLRAGIHAAAILASSTLYFAMAHVDTLDMGLSLFLQLAVIAAAFSLSARTSAREHALWIHLAWLGAALAVLSKGLVGLVLPGAALVAYSLWFRDYRLWRRLYPVSGGLLFLLVAAPWFVAVSRANPDFAWFFFVHEHFTRYTTTQHHRSQPWWFFLPVLVTGALPWTVVMLQGWWQTVRRRDDGADAAPARLLAVWALVVLAFFSVSGSKLIPYIVPMLPALALLGARLTAALEPEAIARKVFRPVLAVALVLALVPVAALWFTPAPAMRWSSALGEYMLAAAALWLTGVFLASRFAKPGDTTSALVVIAVAVIAAHQLLLAGSGAYDPSRTTAALAAQLKPRLGEATRLYVVEMYPQSLPWYLGRTATPVAFRGELDFGMERAPEKAVPSVAAFVEQWRRDVDAVAVMTPARYRELAALGTPMTVVAEDAARIAVRR